MKSVIKKIVLETDYVNNVKLELPSILNQEIYPQDGKIINTIEIDNIKHLILEFEISPFDIENTKSGYYNID